MFIRPLVAVAVAVPPSLQRLITQQGKTRLMQSCTIHTNQSHQMSQTNDIPITPSHAETRVRASLQPYDRHIFIASGTGHSEWTKRLEDVESNPARELTTGESIYNHFIDAIKANQFTSNSPLQPEDTWIPTQPITKRPRVTLFDIDYQLDHERFGWYPTKLPSPMKFFKETDLLVFSQTEPPTHISLTSPGIEPTVEDLRTNTPIDTRYQPELQRILRILGQPTPSNSSREICEPPGIPQLYAFVCCHSQRDERYGERGLAIVDTIRAYAKKLICKGRSPHVHIRAFPCSHVGGDEFAGNVLLYGFYPPPTIKYGVESYPSLNAMTPIVVNDWFGLVAPEQVTTLLDSYTSYLQQIPFRRRDNDDDDDDRSDDIRLQTLHFDLLQQKLLTSASRYLDDRCTSCLCYRPCEWRPAPKLTTSAVTRLGHLWRGSMGMDRTEARELVRILDYD